MTDCIATGPLESLECPCAYCRAVHAPTADERLARITVLQESIFDAQGELVELAAGLAPDEIAQWRQWIDDDYAELNKLQA